MGEHGYHQCAIRERLHSPDGQSYIICLNCKNYSALAHTSPAPKAERAIREDYSQLSRNLGRSKTNTRTANLVIAWRITVKEYNSATSVKEKKKTGKK